jgi:RNA polymerase sigma-B factor
MPFAARGTAEKVTMGRPRARQHDEPPESAELLERLATAPAAELPSLRERLVIAWMPMAERLARRYRGRGEAMEDLLQVAALGLVKAVNRYDPARGGPFPGFAVPTIDGELKRHFRDHVWSLHVPRPIKELRARVRAACRELGTDDPAAVAARTGLPEDEVRDALASMGDTSTLSLDRPLDGATATLRDTLGEEDPALDAVVDREALRPRLRELADRERALLFLRYFRDMKQSEIGARLGISQMHVSRLLRETCQALRTAVLGDADGCPPPAVPARGPDRAERGR